MNQIQINLNGKITVLFTVYEKFLFQLTKSQRFYLVLAILVGGGMGLLATIATNTSTKWVAVIIVAAITPSVLLLINDVKKLILITIVADLALGIDIAVQNQGWHNSGPTGYMVSLVTISLIVGYALWFIDKKPKPRFFPFVTIAGLLYILMAVVSFYITHNAQLTAFGVFLKIQAFLMYFYLINHVSTWNDIRLIITTAAICLLLESILMVFQYFTGFDIALGGLVTSSAIDGHNGVGVTGSRVAGTLAVPATAALYLNSMVTLVFAAYIGEKFINRHLALFAFSIGIVALVATSSRGGWIAFVVAMIILIGRSVLIGNKKAVLIFLMGSVLVGIFLGSQIEKRLVTVTEDESREQLAYGAHNIIRAFPFGIGDNNYDQVMSDKYAHSAWLGAKHPAPHNTYLSIWAEMGPQGLIAFCIFIISLCWQAGRWYFRKNPPSSLIFLATGLLGGVITHVIHMQSETFTARPQVLLIWFLAAMLVIVNKFIIGSEST